MSYIGLRHLGLLRPLMVALSVAALAAASAWPVEAQQRSLNLSFLGSDPWPDLVDTQTKEFRYAGGSLLAAGKSQRQAATAEEALGAESLDIAKSLEDYASLLRKMNREAEAAKMEARAKAIRVKHARENQNHKAGVTHLNSNSLGNGPLPEALDAQAKEFRYASGSLLAGGQPHLQAAAASAGRKSGGLPAPHDQPAHPSHKSGVNLAEKATDPSAVLMQMQTQFFSTHDRDGDFGQVVLQPILPINRSNVTRITIPIKWTSQPDRTGGLGDTTILHFKLFQTKSSTFGVGPTIVLPTATDNKLGSGKLSLGPNFLWIYHGVPKLIAGVLMEQAWSVAGDSGKPHVNEFLWQPILTKHFDWGYLSWSSQQWAIQWNDNAFSAPVGLVIGKVFLGKTPMNVSVEPYWTYRSRATNQYGVKFQWTLIFPGFHWPWSKS